MKLAIGKSGASAADAGLGFIGGTPLVPRGFVPPLSILTGAPMAFLFQLFFPADHVLGGSTLVQFFAVDDVTEDLIVPPLSCGDLSRMAVTQDDLATQQALHAIFLFDAAAAEPAPELASPVEYRLLTAATGARDETLFGKLGPSADWILEDETPGLLDGAQAPIFCLQTPEYLAFPRLSDAPAQVVVDFLDPSGKGMREEPDYEMFAGNAVYYFAYPGQRRVAIVVQGE